MLARIYDFLIGGLGLLTGTMVAFVFVTIVVGVTIRGLGWQPAPWPVPVTEYALLYITMLGSPWLLRSKGHIVVDSFVRLLHPRVSRPLQAIVCALCVGVAAVIAYIAFDTMMLSIARGDQDVRAITVPRAILFAPIWVGFSFMAIEFLRLLRSSESLTQRDSTNKEIV